MYRADLVSLSLTVLGCSGSYAGPDGACTGYLIESAETSVWLDAGPGTLSNLQKHSDLSRLDALVLTHEHADHWLEVPVLINALRYYVGRLGLPVYSNASTRELASRVMDDPAGMAEAFDWHTVADGSVVTIGDQTWKFADTIHYVPTLSVRVESGARSLVFSADTGPGWSPDRLGDGPDVLLCESTFASREGNEEIQHLSASEAAQIAHDCDAGRLVLTHLAPGQVGHEHAAIAAATYSGPIEVATVGATFDI